MQPTLWQPPLDPSPTEQAIIKRIRRAKLFVFLREHRQDIFNAAFQEELSSLYRDSKRGQPPIPRRNWRLRRCCKPIPAPLMMRSLKRPPWIDAGNWSWTV